MTVQPAEPNPRPRDAACAPAPAGAHPSPNPTDGMPHKGISHEQLMHGLMAAILIGGLLLRFWGLDSQSIWYDEANGIRIASRPIPEIFTELRADASPPLYYLVLHAWIAWLGTGEFAVRSLSAILGAAFVALVLRTAREHWNAAAAVAAGALAAASQFHLYYSQEARMYAMLTCFTMLAIHGALRASARNGAGDWCLYGAGVLLAAYTHNYGLFVGLGTAAWLVGRARSKAELRTPMLVTHCAVAVLYAPWVPFAIRHQVLGTAITGGWLPRFQPGHIAETLRHFTSMSMFSPSGLLFWLGVPAYGLPVAASIMVVDHGSGRPRIRLRADPVVWLCVSVLFCGTVLPMLVSSVHPIYLAHRYSIAVWPAFVLLLGHGLSRLSPKLPRAVTAGALAAVCVGAIGWHRTTMHKASDRDVATRLAEIIQPNDLVVFSPHWTAVSIQYYLGDLPNQAGFPMKLLSERKNRNEALERETRSPKDMIDFTRARLEVLGGRLVYVSMPWADYARDLQQAFDQQFHSLGSGTEGQFQVNVYHLSEPDRKDGP